MVNKTGFENLRILVADRNPEFKMVMRTLLNSLKIMQFKFITSAKLTFEAANTGKFDVAIIDRNLEDYPGIAAVNMMRMSPRSQETMLPVIMMAANWNEAQIKVARDAGVNEYLAKPFSPAHFLKRLDAIIHHPRPFVKDDAFFGPDRRRLGDLSFSEAERRYHEPDFIEPDAKQRASA